MRDIRRQVAVHVVRGYVFAQERMHCLQRARAVQRAQEFNALRCGQQLYPCLLYTSDAADE